MNRELFEQEIAKTINTKYGTVEYALKKNRRGEYVKYETKLAWEWWNKALKEVGNG